MDSARARALSSLDFRDPRLFLVSLRKLELAMLDTTAPEKVRELRTNQLREWRELREAAIFCHLMSLRTEMTVAFAKGEAQDCDFMARWVSADTLHYAPVQLNEVVPATTNALSSLEDVVSSLTKYVDSRELVVAIHLNRELHFDPTQVAVPDLHIGQPWVFAAVSPDQTSWGLWGDLPELPVGTKHEYPST